MTKRTIVNLVIISIIGNFLGFHFKSSAFLFYGPPNSLYKTMKKSKHTGTRSPLGRHVIQNYDLVGYVMVSSPTVVVTTTTSRSLVGQKKHTRLFSSSGSNNNNNNNNNDNNNDDLWKDLFRNDDDDNDDNNNNNNMDGTKEKKMKLGIDIGPMMIPLSDEEVKQLKSEVSELISDKIAEGINDITTLRQQLYDDIVRQSKLRSIQSQRNTNMASQNLLTKIDNLTNDFLNQTHNVRTTTKQAAAADRANTNKMDGRRSSRNRGVEWGSWGRLNNGGDVSMIGKNNNNNWDRMSLGSMDDTSANVDTTTTTPDMDVVVENDDDEDDRRRGVLSETKQTIESLSISRRNNRILVLADPSEDPVARTLLPIFTDLLSKVTMVCTPGKTNDNDRANNNGGVSVTVMKPTQTMPLGGNNAACILCFATSLSDATSFRKTMLDRLLRRTLSSNGQLVPTPTQIVCLSTLGTARTNKLPYSMQNLIGGNVLNKRRQVEEAIINTVRQRIIGPPLDYTIMKIGDLKSSSSSSTVGTTFQLSPGDVLDGTTSPDLAAHALLQAVALQPFARNATFGIVGTYVPSSSTTTTNAADDQPMWDQAFVKLDGPELERYTDGLGDAATYFDQLNEYLGEWATMVEQSAQRMLATPVRTVPSTRQSNLIREGVKERTGVRLLFLPTNTGSAYMSKAEERARERQDGGDKRDSTPGKRRTKPEGGVEVLVEVTDGDSLRVRARRCNMADDTVLKEISEETILKRLSESLEVWKKDVVSSSSS